MGQSAKFGGAGKSCCLGEGGDSVKHSVLGEIEESGDVFDYVATILYCQRDIEIHILLDDKPFEVVLQLASEVALRLKELDETAKQIAVVDLRETYNNGWNEYEELQDDGSLKSVTNPQLSEAEFEANLSLSSVTIIGDCGVDLVYEDQDMFWGHCVTVNSTNGVDLSEAHAELSG
ncbi:DUF2262 domain-containing protein [Singulisphaera rosea]